MLQEHAIYHLFDLGECSNLIRYRQATIATVSDFMLVFRVAALLYKRISGSHYSFFRFPRQGYLLLQVLMLLLLGQLRELHVHASGTIIVKHFSLKQDGAKSSKTPNLSKASCYF